MDSRRTKVMVDTNVLVDYLIPTRECHAAALDLFSLIWAVRIEAAFSTQSMLDAAYVCRRQSASPGFRHVLLELLHRTNASYIDTGDMSQALRDPNSDIEDRRISLILLLD